MGEIQRSVLLFLFILTCFNMDHTDEQYDPDGDVSRFFGSPDHHEELLLSPQPFSHEEVYHPILPLLPQQFNPEVLQQLPLVVPQEALQQAAPLLMQEQTPLLLPEEVCQQMPPLVPQEVLQQNQGLEGTNTVPAPAVDHMDTETEVSHQPISIEGVIIAAMEGIPVEGSSSSNPRNDALFEPIFHHYEPGQRDCSDCIPLRQVLHSSREFSV
jgi:hypothetical protein